MSPASITLQFDLGKLERFRLSPHPHPVSLFSSHLLGGWTRSGVQALLFALQLQRRRSCAEEWFFECGHPCRLLTRQFQEQGKGEGRGVGSGSYPLQARVEYDRGAISRAKSWQSGCLEEREAPAGACWRWDPGAACWTDWFNRHFCQTKPKWLQESPGQKLTKPPAFPGWIKPWGDDAYQIKFAFFLAR